MFCFTVFIVLKLSSALFFYAFLFYTSKDDEVVGAVYIVWEANSRTRTFAIPGQAPPLQLGFNFCLNDSLKTCKYFILRCCIPGNFCFNYTLKTCRYNAIIYNIFLDRPHLRNFCFNYSSRACKYFSNWYVDIFLDRPHLRNWASTFASTIVWKLANISPIANIYNLINIDSNHLDVQLSWCGI